MLSTTEKYLFTLLIVITGGLAVRTFKTVYDIVRRGEPDLSLRDLPTRLWESALVFVTQRTVLKTRRRASIFHALVAWGFIYYLIVNLGDLLEGYIPNFRFLGAGIAGNLYRFGADVLSIGALLGMTMLLVRRFVAQAPEFFYNDNVTLYPKARSGIRRDSLIVGVFILLHVGFRFLGASFKVAAAGGGDPWQPFASLVAGLLNGMSETGLMAGERLGFWVALGLIFIFLPYFPYTKHLHLIAGPINYLTRPRRRSPGALNPIDFEDETREEFGVRRIDQLPQTQILDAFACIMCNRCQDVCPAYVTGKELSPSALEVNKRYLIKSHMRAIAGGADSPELLGAAISESALWACTSCGACVEVCPVGNEPMFDILDIRRYRVLTEGAFPNELQNAFNGMERQGNPWQMGTDRLAWAEGLDVPTVEDNPDFEYLYWVGCAASYDPRARKVARAFVSILRAANVNYAVLGQMESCTGDTARRAGYEYLFSEMASANIDTLKQVKARKIVATCPHCLHTLGSEYPQFGSDFEVLHHTQLINQLVGRGLIQTDSQAMATVTFHDPCYLGRHNDITAEPRAALEGVNANLVEMARSGKNSFCCGAGGGQMWKEEEHGNQGVNANRFAEAQATGAQTLAVGCPFCLVMLTDANQAAGNTMEVRDVAEIVAAAMGA